MSLIVHVVGARPNFIKAAPVITALRTVSGVEQQLVHTGQHYDEGLSEALFADLALPAPDWQLNAGAGGAADQIAYIEDGLSGILAAIQPDLVVVYGDVTSTVAGARAAAAAGIPVAHVEAGLRSFDLSMPEERNRMAVDRLATILLTPSEDANENLRREGMAESQIRFVGNVMIDALLAHRAGAPWPEVARRFGVRDRAFALLTLHRQANVDDAESLERILTVVESAAVGVPIIFPVHPRTARQLDRSGLAQRASFLTMTEPLGYLQFLALLDHAAFVLTDSGGIQEETTVLGVPCFTLRDNTERPVTIEQGTNTLVGADAHGLDAALRQLRRDGARRACVPDKWDGASARRVADVLAGFLDRATRPSDHDL